METPTEKHRHHEHRHSSRSQHTKHSRIEGSNIRHEAVSHIHKHQNTVSTVTDGDHRSQRAQTVPGAQPHHHHHHHHQSHQPHKYDKRHSRRHKSRKSRKSEPYDQPVEPGPGPFPGPVLHAAVSETDSAQQKSLRRKECVCSLFLVVGLTLFTYSLYYYVAKKCPFGLHQCPDKSCVFVDQICDGIFNCKDRSDEKDCDCEKHGLFRCARLQVCLAKSKICNGINDCIYHEDETNCTKCEGFQCPNGWCLAKGSRCDKYRECLNGEDEAQCECGEKEYVCEDDKDKKCLLKSWVCDGIQDCDSNEDEATDCLERKAKVKSPCNGFQCRDHSGCIDISKRCDETMDCTDNSDEASCVQILSDTDLVRVYNYKSKSFRPICSSGWQNSDKLNSAVCYQVAAGKSAGWTPETQKDENDGFYSLKKDAGFSDLPKKIFSVIEVRSTCQSGQSVAVKCRWDSCGTVARQFRTFFGTQPSAPKSIVNGKPAKLGQFPWFAAVFMNENLLCGASVLAKQWLLTAAHCVDTAITKPEKFRIRLGSTYLYGNDVGEQNYRVVKIYAHPKWDKPTVSNDLAILKLDKPVRYTDYVRPICLPTGTNINLTTFAECHAAGYGLIDSVTKITPGRLQEARLDINNDALCKVYLPKYYNNVLMLCAGSPTGYTSICSGDSGGPLMCRDYRDVWTLVGISSWSPVKENDKSYCTGTSVFARVTHFRKWIVDTISDNSIITNG